MDTTKVVQINTTCGVGSTGKIAVSISELLTEQNIENYILYSTDTSGYPRGISCGGSFERKVQAFKSHVLGNYGFNSKLETMRMIRELDRIAPTVVLLHNIHGHDCNLELLFAYFRQKRIKLFWTSHDCWAFTGYCTHFTYAHCDKWRNGCNHCPQWKQYSWFMDRGATLYQRKKDLFTGLDLTIITPSQWLADLVKQSFLKEYPVKVIHNGIDLSVFKPTPSDFRERYQIGNEKKMLLGVAFGWGTRKGLDIFIELSKRLDPEKYQIVLVGTDEQVDKQLPTNIISIHRTQNQTELAQIYTAADVFVNPTREDNYPTVNMEAIACGTPVITFNTGGSPEIVDDGTGSVVDEENIDMLVAYILAIQEEKYSTEKCIEHAKQFDNKVRFEEYVRLLTGE